MHRDSFRQFLGFVYNQTAGAFTPHFKHSIAHELETQTLQYGSHLTLHQTIG